MQTTSNTYGKQHKTPEPIARKTSFLPKNKGGLNKKIRSAQCRNVHKTLTLKPTTLDAYSFILAREGYIQL